MRQEELDELIEKERKERQQSLDNEMVALRQSQIALINAETSASQMVFEKKKEELAKILSDETENCNA